MATALQERAFDKVLENGGKSVSTAMLAAGYTPATSKNPNKLTNSKAWQKLMKTYISDTKLATLHKKLLEKKEIVITQVGKGESQWEYTGQPHTDSLKALDIALRLKAKFPQEDKESGDRILILNVTGESANRYGASATGDVIIKE